MNPNPIVQTAMKLLEGSPALSAMEILDRAMEAHRGTSPDFEVHPKVTCRLPYVYCDDTDPASPFGELLRKAFAPELELREVLRLGLVEPSEGSRLTDIADAWETVIEKFADRYELWRS